MIGASLKMNIVLSARKMFSLVKLRGIRNYARIKLTRFMEFMTVCLVLVVTILGGRMQIYSVIYLILKEVIKF